MASLVCWVRHASYELQHLKAISDFLCQPIFDVVKRSAMIDRDKRVGRKRKSRAVLLEQLGAPRSQGITLDDGTTELSATAYFRFDMSSDTPYPAPNLGYVIVQYKSEHLEVFLASFRTLFAQLNGVLGWISVEPSHAEAHSVSLGMDNRETRARSDMSDQRRRERMGQGRLRTYPTKLPAIHWGTFISQGHLAAVGLEQLQASPAFFRVEPVAADQPHAMAFLQLTADPIDALAPGYEQTLDAARAALAPLMLDVSDIELED